MINYDAITLGNHDFDFGYDYIVSQLEMSGLMEKCVLSNVYSSINGNNVFGVENKIIEKKIKSAAGTCFLIYTWQRIMYIILITYRKVNIPAWQ